ncbi:MAG: AmmeMemoRadiSam system protein A [Kiritimatiellia bacterium]
MVPGSFNQELLAWAREALDYGVRHGHPPSVEPGRFSAEALRSGAVFVTLEKNGRLRGCIGHLEATQSLVDDIAGNAVAAALHDPRFPPVTEDELAQIELSLSVLTPPEPMIINDEDDLVRQLRPGVDGLILEKGSRRATFLPSVWEDLPDPRSFIRQLKLKAGWSPDYWSDSIMCSRYQTVHIQ